MNSSDRQSAAGTTSQGRSTTSAVAALALCAGVLAALVAPAWAAAATAEGMSANAGTANGFNVAAASKSTGSSEAASLQMVGEARLRVLLWSIYTSRLYTPTGSYTTGERPLRLEIEYLINVKATALVDRTAREWDAMGREHPRQEDWLQRLENLWPNVDKRDVLTLEVDEDDVSTFFLNGKQLGRIEDPAFGEQFLAIWLSEDSTRPSLRKELIGMTGLD